MGRASACGQVRAKTAEVGKQVRAGSEKSLGHATGARAPGLGLLCWEAAMAQLHMEGVCPGAPQETPGDANTAAISRVACKEPKQTLKPQQYQPNLG